MKQYTLLKPQSQCRRFLAETCLMSQLATDSVIRRSAAVVGQWPSHVSLTQTAELASEQHVILRSDAIGLYKRRVLFFLPKS